MVTVGPPLFLLQKTSQTIPYLEVKPQELVFGPLHYSGLKKAKDAETYIYQKSTYQLSPDPSASVIKIRFFVSNGYLVFVPDIKYEIGLPGPSAYNCVVPGVQEMIAKGFVDPVNIGIQGQSWGGYQAAYIITRTDLFKAAGTGAPVANMTSARYRKGEDPQI